MFLAAIEPFEAHHCRTPPARVATSATVLVAGSVSL
jgi:hypothetical protein